MSTDRRSIDALAEIAAERVEDASHAVFGDAIDAATQITSWPGDVDPPSQIAYAESVRTICRQLIANALDAALDTSGPRPVLVVSGEGCAYALGESGLVQALLNADGTVAADTFAPVVDWESDAAEHRLGAIRDRLADAAEEC